MTDHIAKAKNYIAKGEDYYRKAAEEIVAAKDADPSLTNAKIADELGRSKAWVGYLIRWVNNGDPDHPSPFQGSAEVRERSVARKLARETPEVLVAAIAAAPPKAQRKIADAIVSRSTEPSLTKAVAPGPPKPRQPKPTETKLGDAVFALWEVGEQLMDETPAGDAKVRMTALAEKAQRLADGIVQLLDTGEFEDAFRELVAEVGAEA